MKEIISYSGSIIDKDRYLLYLDFMATPFSCQEKLRLPNSFSAATGQSSVSDDLRVTTTVFGSPIIPIPASKISGLLP